MCVESLPVLVCGVLQFDCGIFHLRCFRAEDGGGAVPRFFPGSVLRWRDCVVLPRPMSAIATSTFFVSTFGKSHAIAKTEADRGGVAETPHLPILRETGDLRTADVSALATEVKDFGWREELGDAAEDGDEIALVVKVLLFLPLGAVHCAKPQSSP